MANTKDETKYTGGRNKTSLRHSGFRKYFKAQSEQARIPSIKIEILMGHSLRVKGSYARFTEDEILEDYLGIDHLTVSQNLVMISKNLKQQEYMQNSFKGLEEKHKKRDR